MLRGGGRCENGIYLVFTIKTNRCSKHDAEWNTDFSAFTPQQTKKKTRKKEEEVEEKKIWHGSNMKKGRKYIPLKPLKPLTYQSLAHEAYVEKENTTFICSIAHVHRK